MNATMTSREPKAEPTHDREMTITRWDGENRPVGVNVATGIVDRPNSYYPAPLRGDIARGLFLDLIGITYGHEVPALIKACNRAASRKNLGTDEDRREAALRYAGIIPAEVKAAKRHKTKCDCPRCLMEHVKAGCRIPFCKVCFG